MCAVFASEICNLNLKECQTELFFRMQDSVGNVSWNQCVFFYLQE